MIIFLHIFHTVCLCITWYTFVHIHAFDINYFIFKGIIILSMAIGSYNITYPPDIPDYLNDMLKDFLKK
jgi:hypothetical protein